MRLSQLQSRLRTQVSLPSACSLEILDIVSFGQKICLLSCLSILLTHCLAPLQALRQERL